MGGGVGDGVVCLGMGMCRYNTTCISVIMVWVIYGVGGVELCTPG